VQFGVGGDEAAADGFVAVSQVRGDHELAFAAFFHAGDAFVPAFDDLADAEFEGERLAAIDDYFLFVEIGVG
jgi:hypothetical protein